jgi:hypothetical protein
LKQRQQRNHIGVPAWRPWWVWLLDCRSCVQQSRRWEPLLLVFQQNL